MAPTISFYNHTARLIADGTTSGATYNLILCTAATFDPTDQLLADVAYTEVANGNGYTTGGQEVTGVTIATVATNDAKIDADDAVWPVSGGQIAANTAILHLLDEVDDPPLAFIDFDGTQTDNGIEFRVIWNAGGIFTFTVA